MNDFELCAGSVADGSADKRILRVHLDHFSDIVQAFAVNRNTKEKRLDRYEANGKTDALTQVSRCQSI